MSTSTSLPRVGLTFRVGYLTPRETRIWDLRRHNLSQSDIGRELGISRQAVHKACQIIDKKVEQAFIEAAETNRLDVKTINLVEGVMEAYSPAHDLLVVVSLGRTNGLKLWYLYEGHCETCHLESSCRKVLEAEAKERGIRLSTADKLITPTQLAHKIFGRYHND
jgi:DNA-binding CsgD family transcriptional regulator